MTGLLRYNIETRRTVTGYWKIQRECECNYELEEYTGRFLGLFWKKLKSRVINWKEAELRCRREVMMCRRSYETEFKDVRVVKVTCVDDYTYRSVVWENGVWKDC